MTWMPRMPWSLPEGLSELVDAHQPAPDFLGICDVSCSDPFLESVEAPLFTLYELEPVAAAERAEGTHEAPVGVDCPVQFQSAGNGGKGAPIFTQREHLCVDVLGRGPGPSRRLHSLGRGRTPLRRTRTGTPRHGTSRTCQDGRPRRIFVRL